LPPQILFITATRIGDAVLSTGILRYLLQLYPGAQLTIACGAPAVELFAALPNNPRIVIIDKKPWGRHWLELWWRVARRRYTVVVDLRRSLLAYCVWAGQRYIAGPGDPNLHKVQNLGMVLGLNPPPAPRLWIADTHRQRIAGLFLDMQTRPMLVFAPTANWGGKIWGGGNFVALMRRMTAADGFLPGARVVIIGAAAEKNQTDPVVRGMADYPYFTDLTGSLDLLSIAALLERAAMFIGHDSGLMHMAAAVGGNVLGLFGPSPEHIYAPWATGLGQAAYVRTPETYRQLVDAPDFDYRSEKSLMTNLTVDAVYTAAEKLWQRIGQRRAA
jgi:heptosyltransferase III